MNCWWNCQGCRNHHTQFCGILCMEKEIFYPVKPKWVFFLLDSITVLEILPYSPTGPVLKLCIPLPVLSWDVPSHPSVRFTYDPFPPSPPVSGQCRCRYIMCILYGLKHETGPPIARVLHPLKSGFLINIACFMTIQNENQIFWIHKKKSTFKVVPSTTGR